MGIHFPFIRGYDCLKRWYLLVDYVEMEGIQINMIMTSDY